MDVHKSIRPDRGHLRVTEELADVIEGPISITFERLWQLEKIPNAWKKADVAPVPKRVTQIQGTCSWPSSP